MINLRPIKSTYLFLVVLLFFQFNACAQKSKEVKKTTNSNSIVSGSNRINDYLPLLLNKRVAIVANQTSVVFHKNGHTHLVDSLLALNIIIEKVFAPEHGFRGKADAGEVVKDGLDAKTGLPIISLYGKNKKPSPSQLKGIEIILFDIQDVGARFYTYLSTLHYVMEAAAEAKIPVVVLDRPNPNGHYIDGPVLEEKHSSFVGLHPVPVVYGMTIGEYAQMINGEGWLKEKAQCDLTVIPLKNYTHNSVYDLPIKPSPNLPNAQSINLYPSLCFFEGTNVSAGRGTQMQFQVYGSPYLKETKFSFTPKPNEGSKYPKHNGKECYGEDLRNHKRLNQLNLQWLQKAHGQNNTAGSFFNSFFVKLAGTESLEAQIVKGLTEEEIRESWLPGLKKFKKIREKYLLYK